MTNEEFIANLEKKHLLWTRARQQKIFSIIKKGREKKESIDQKKDFSDAEKLLQNWQLYDFNKKE